jgi:VWFA-related protein
VVLPVRVLDNSGRPLEADLPQSAFTVFEDGVTQSIRSFQHDDVPVSIGLVIDRSGSMSYKLDTVATSALTLVRNSHSADEIFVVNFSRHPFLDADFTSDQRAVGDALQRGTIRGNTALWDAVQFSLRHMKTSALRERKVLIVFSDGNDIESSVSAESVAQEAQRAEITVYAFAFGTESRQGRNTLNKLTRMTGGETFLPARLDDVDGLVRRLARDIRRQYTITYSPSNSTNDGRCRKIIVKLKGGLKSTVRTRTAYCPAFD